MWETILINPLLFIFMQLCYEQMRGSVPFTPRTGLKSWYRWLEAKCMGSADVTNQDSPCKRRGVPSSLSPSHSDSRRFSRLVTRAEGVRARQITTTQMVGMPKWVVRPLMANMSVSVNIGIFIGPFPICQLPSTSQFTWHPMRLQNENRAREYMK